MPPLEDLLNATFPIYYLYQTSTASITVTTVLVTGLGLCTVGSGMSVFASTTRITWAWARDGGRK